MLYWFRFRTYDIIRACSFWCQKHLFQCIMSCHEILPCCHSVFYGIIIKNKKKWTLFLNETKSKSSFLSILLLASFTNQNFFLDLNYLTVFVECTVTLKIWTKRRAKTIVFNGGALYFKSTHASISKVTLYFWRHVF